MSYFSGDNCPVQSVLLSVLPSDAVKCSNYVYGTGVHNFSNNLEATSKF